ncbi:alpha/beta fold hydrolase [Marinicaulis aureus]|uniref:Alpha/beta fold hydrolase n=1 Tax=Hyphococcus aureus TaxID=2666033 RepID=A0ABW1KZJ8_9PROT
MTDLTIKNGDLNLAASVYGPEGAPAVLCLHGIAGARDTWQETVRRYEDRFQVWTLDFRGHGHSDRAESYLVEDYAADAAAALDFIRRPTIIVSHSLGAVTGAFLAQQPHPFLKALFMEDPPYYFGEAAEFAKSGNDKRFDAVQKMLIAMREKGAGLGEYLSAAGDAPAPQGGVQADHSSARHILSAASGLMRQDPACWTPAKSTAVFESFKGDEPLKVPAMLVRADPELGPGFTPEHESRFLAANPDATVEMIEGAPHRIHATIRHQPRYYELLDAFLAQNREG